ncbi:tripartite tricarboxylate transporter TctB family protein [Neobacillus muris]|uniref:tripartite tricarboxylate transporter TctB family protein n=1 Tax=Neobacillus muris TaxID=2941334 RepID=UPI00203DD02C|nr:tripartite tricarboxylate transporter TctB family protein [Neobacillus muris]
MAAHAKYEKKIGGSIAILIGLISIYEAYKLYPYSVNIVTGDHALPGFIGILLVAVGISLFVEKKGQEESHSVLPTGKKRFKLSASVILLFIYCILIEYFGYVASTLVVSIILIKLIAQNRWMNAVLIGGLITAVLYGLFIVILKTPFPVGIFSFL